MPQNINGDVEERRLLDFLMTLVEPRMPGVQVHAVRLEVGAARGFAVVVRMPDSWAIPHRVRPTAHFSVREGRRKRQLDVPEIGALFLRSDNQAQKVRDFRTARLSKILTGETPHKLADGPQLVVHLIPTQAALGLMHVDPVVLVNNRRQVPWLPPREPRRG